MTEAPPVLAQHPQFTPQYWRNVPRQTMRTHIDRVTNKDGNRVEIVLKGGMAFQRDKDEIKQLLTANAEVEIESIGQGRIITGLMVPGVGWAFRMTAEDLAEYTKNLAMAQHEHKVKMVAAMVDHVGAALDAVLEDHNILPGQNGERKELANELAAEALYALEVGPE